MELRTAAGRAATWTLALAALAGAYAWRRSGPGSPRWRFRRAARAPFEPPARAATAADLEGLPAPISRYLGAVGVVGRPIPTGFRARFTGRIRSAPDGDWITFTAEQVSRFAPHDARWFHMDARMKGLPVEVLHHLDGRTATMRADALSLVPVVAMGGPEADRAEAVTFLNDLCLFAPAALLAAPVAWSAIDDHRARVDYDHHGLRVGAVVTIDDEGRLTDFVSTDRIADAGTPRSRRLDWSTPMDATDEFDGVRLGSRGAARWREHGAWWTYIETTVEDVTYG